MAKGFFTQGVVVLFARAPSLPELEHALSPFEIAGRSTSRGAAEFGGETLLVSFRPEVNGYVAVDIWPHPWPDDMGDPKGNEMVFGAWALGHFGPLTYPGNLQRAVEQAWHWPEAKARCSGHAACVRIRSSYVFGGRKDAPVLPPQYDALRELRTVTEIAAAILECAGALCYFDPAGEMLWDAADVKRVLARARQGGLAPLELWSNVRLFRAGGSPAWMIMDTVGMGQLDVPDHEACFEADRYEPRDVAGFLRSISDYVLQRGEVIKDGDTADGPGSRRWRAASFEDSLVQGPRRVLRWFPMDGTTPPRAMLGRDS